MLLSRLFLLVLAPSAQNSTSKFSFKTYKYIHKNRQYFSSDTGADCCWNIKMNSKRLKIFSSVSSVQHTIQHTCMQATYHRISVWALGISIANFFCRCCICFCFCISFDIIRYDTRKKSIRKSYEHVTIWIVVHCVEMLSFISLNWNIHAGDSKLSNKPPTHLYSHTFFYVLFDSPPHTHKFRSNN